MQNHTPKLRRSAALTLALAAFVAAIPTVTAATGPQTASPAYNGGGS